MTKPINSYAINTSPVPITVSAGDYSFNGFALNDGINITIQSIDNDDLTKVDLSTFDFAYNHGGAISSRYYRGKQIHITGTIKASTEQLFQKYIDTLKKSLSKVGGVLKIRNRKIKATLTKMAYDRNNYNITWSPIDLVFTTVDSFWNEGSISKGYLGLTGTLNEEVTYDGSAPSSPVWYMVFGTGTATTQVKLTHKGLDLTIVNTFAPGDVLLIDGINKEVRKNGVEIDFTGVFPEFTELSNPFTIGYTGTTLVDTTLIFDLNYL